jgi:hypothetical protein
MFNLDQIAKHLQDPAVTMQDLIGYVQNPNGMVPSVLALAELKRRQQTEAGVNAQQAKGLPTVAQKTVADAAQTMPRGIQSVDPRMVHRDIAMLRQPEDRASVKEAAGISELPLPDHMYEDKNYAAGGIIAFDDGGSIWDKARDYLLPPSPTTMRSLQGQTRNPFMGGMPPADSDPTTLLYQLKALNAKPNKTLDDWNQISAVEDQIKGAYKDTRGGYAPQAPAAKSNAQVAIDQSASNIPSQAPTGVESLIPKNLTVQEAIDMKKEALKEIGVDPEFYAKQEAKNAEERKALEGDKDFAKWMAVTRAGLGMASSGIDPITHRRLSPLESLAQGTTQGLTQYAGDIKDIKAQDRLLKAADDKLAEAQNAQQRGDADAAIKAIQERDKLIAEYQHYKMVTGATIQAANIAAGSRTGTARLSSLFGALNKATDPAEKAQIQAEIDRITAGEGSEGIIPSGVTVTKNK